MTGEPFDRADSANPGSLGDRLDDLLIKAENRLARSRFGIVAGLAVALAAAAAWWALATPGSVAPIEDSIPLAGSTSLPPATVPASGPGASGVDAVDPGAENPPTTVVGEAPQEEVVVHVIGAVERPGLVSLMPGDRISDAVDAAGGGRPEADLERLNLATPVVDGMQIRVPVTDEEPDDVEGRPLVQLPVNPATSAAPGADG
ncbi:MAG: SLBB domain-containing protein, partial [Actinomycetota bacterium]